MYSLIIVGINTIKFLNESKFFTGSRDGTIKLWHNNNDSIQIKANFLDHIDWVNDICFSRDKSIMFSCSNDSNILLWDISAFQRREEIYNDLLILHSDTSINLLNKDFVSSICYNDKYNLLLSGCLDSKICIYDIVSCKKEIKQIDERNILYSFSDNSVFCIDVDDDAKIIVSSVYDRVNKIINIANIRNR